MKFFIVFFVCLTILIIVMAKYNPPRTVTVSNFEPKKDFEKVQKMEEKVVKKDIEEKQEIQRFDAIKSLLAREGDRRVPVPVGTLKQTNERYLAPFVHVPKKEDRRRENGGTNFVGSSDAPFFREVDTKWERIGLLVECKRCGGENCPEDGERKKGEIMNLYRRPIAPLQDLWEYLARDKDGFEIKLERRDLLENGDVVHYVDGKGGPWCVANYSENRWIWV